MGRTSVYDEIELEDLTWDATKRVYHYPCPCGDRFEISKRQLADGEDIATCPSCSLLIRVIYDYLEFQDYQDDADDAAASAAPVVSAPPVPIAVA